MLLDVCGSVAGSSCNLTLPEITSLERRIGNINHYAVTLPRNSESKLLIRLFLISLHQIKSHSKAMTKLPNAFHSVIVWLLLLPVHGFFNPSPPTPPVDNPAQNTPAPPIDNNGFGIWVSYSQDPGWIVPDQVAQNIDAAENKWRSVITGNLPSVPAGVTVTPSGNNQFGTCPVPAGEIDDLFMCASAYYSSGSSGVAAAAVVAVRSGSMLPYISVMRYNRYYLGIQTAQDITNMLVRGEPAC